MGFLWQHMRLCCPFHRLESTESISLCSMISAQDSLTFCKPPRSTHRWRHSSSLLLLLLLSLFSQAEPLIQPSGTYVLLLGGSAESRLYTQGPNVRSGMFPEWLFIVLSDLLFLMDGVGVSAQCNTGGGAHCDLFFGARPSRAS